MTDPSPPCPSCRERDARIAALEARVADLEARLVHLQAENRRLRERASRNSTNSSLPPSSDPPGTKRPPPKPPTGRKPGAQPGHPGKARPLLPRDAVDNLQELFPDRCDECSSDLARAPSPDDPEPIRHQLVDIPEVIALVWEYVRHGRRCRGCGKITYAPLPEEVPSHLVGPRLQALLGVLVGRFRISRREVVELLVDLFGPKARLSLGEVSQLEAKTAAVLEPVYQQAQQVVSQQPVVHADETGWGRWGWLWIGTTEAMAVFRVDPSRGREAFRNLMPGFQGILQSDRWSAYQHLPEGRRAICWSHLARDFQALVDRGQPATEVGQALLQIKDQLFAAWGDFKSRKFDRQELIRRIGPIREEMGWALAAGTENPDAKTARFCRNLLELEAALWTFIHVPGVEPTNNRAEQDQRPAVLWRRTCHGCQSDRGARFCERMLTVAVTLRKQGRSVLRFVEDAIRTALTGRDPPRLAPAPSG